MQDIFNFSEISLGGYFPKIVLTVITLVLTAIVRVIVFKVVRKYALASSKLISSRLNAILRICAIIINLLALSILITIWGVKTENIFIALSSVFAIIGVAMFAQWSILSNITAGLIMFFNSPFRVGDYIRLLDKDFPIEAQIVNILTFYTHLQTEDGQLHVFPNNLLLQRGISILKEAPVNNDIKADGL